jgi:uncharacterized protein with PIN domain/sulfur carrier protein ThiS
VDSSRQDHLHDQPETSYRNSVTPANRAVLMPTSSTQASWYQSSHAAVSTKGRVPRAAAAWFCDHMHRSTVRFRVHGELSELVRAGQSLERAVDGTSTVKHLVEELGIPHTEYGQVRVNGVPSHDGHRVQDGDVVDVYSAEVPAPPVSEPRFLLDVHLGTLARYLRLLGFDTAYDNHSGDDDLVARAAVEVRTLLTRDRGLLRRRVLTDARLVRGMDPLEQLIDVVRRLRLGAWIRPYARCTSCNGVLAPVRRADVAPLVPPGTLRDHETFAACSACGKVYWQGAHHVRISALIAAARAADPLPAGRDEPARGKPVGWGRDGFTMAESSG